MKGTFFYSSMLYHFNRKLLLVVIVVVAFVPLLQQQFCNFVYYSTISHNYNNDNDTTQPIFVVSSVSAWIISSSSTRISTSSSTASFRINNIRKITYNHNDNNIINKEKIKFISKYNEMMLHSYRSNDNDKEIDTTSNINEQQQQQQQQQQRSYKLLTWNVLAPIYAPVTKYYYCNPNYVQWSFRYKQILYNLYTSNADIICLQEVQFDSWYDLLVNPILSVLNNDNNSSSKSINNNSNNNNSINNDSTIDFDELLLLQQQTTTTTTTRTTKTNHQTLEQEEDYRQNFNTLIINLKERYHIIVQTVQNDHPVGCVTLICKHKFNIVGRLESRSRALIVTIQEKQQQQQQSQQQLNQQQLLSLNTKNKNIDNKSTNNNNKVLFIVNCHLSAGMDTDVQRYYQIRSLLKRLQAHVNTISNPILFLAGDFNIVNRQLSPIYNLLSTGKALVVDENDIDTDNNNNNNNKHNKNHKNNSKEKSRQQQNQQQRQKQQQLDLRQQSKTKEILKMQVKSNDLILPFLPLQDVFQNCYIPARTTTSSSSAAAARDVKNKKVPSSNWNATATSGPTIYKLRTSSTGPRKYYTNTRFLHTVNTTTTIASDKRKMWWMRKKKMNTNNRVQTTKNSNDIVLGMTFASGHVLDYIWVSKCCTINMKSLPSFVNGTTTKSSVGIQQTNNTTTTTPIPDKVTTTNNEKSNKNGSSSRSSSSDKNKKKKIGKLKDLLKNFNRKEVDTILENDDTNHDDDIIMVQPWIRNLTKASQQSRQYWPSKDNPSDHMPIGAIITLGTPTTKH